MKGHKVWLKPKSLWAYKQARWMTCCCGIFCSRFLPILSPLKIILEMIFWTNLMLDLICTWLEKTRRFCRQVNKKISSCFRTASTCVQRSSLGWCSRLTYMETVDWIHVVVRWSLESEADSWLCRIEPNTSFINSCCHSHPYKLVSTNLKREFPCHRLVQTSTFAVNYSKILDFYKYFIIAFW